MNTDFHRLISASRLAIAMCAGCAFLLTSPRTFAQTDDFITIQGGQATQSGTGQTAKIETTSTGSGANKKHTLKTSGGAGAGGDASAANQTAVQANAGSNANKATAIQGIDSGKPVAVKIDQTTPGTTNAVTDAGSAFTDLNGVGGQRFTSADQSGAVASVTDAPTSGQKLVITDCIVSVDTAMRVDFSVESSATVIESIYMAANSTVNLVTRARWKLATANKKLQIQTSVAGNISVNPRYHSEP